MELAFTIAIPLLLVVAGYLVGRSRERAHFDELHAREQALQHLVVHDLDDLEGRDDVAAAVIVFGESVVASDYYKTFASSLRGIVGGEVKSLVTMLTRARRQAIVRMLEEAQARGAHSVINVRLETTDVGGGRAPFSEVVAYGTALSS
jgi:uncharacterized protein YbjQ (UPF0145 family)